MTARRGTAISTNRERLVTTRLLARVQPTAANVVVAPDGSLKTLPGQGGVVVGIGLGDLAGGWVGDHVEPGVSLGHPDQTVNNAVQVLSCLGNRVIMTDGAAAGAEGVVAGKHGAVLAQFPAVDVNRIAPGDGAVIEACGVGLAIADEPEIAVHSCSPLLLDQLIRGRDGTGRIAVPVCAVLPAEAAGAGIGMPSSRFNIDLQVAEPPIAALARSLRFGDVVALLDHDHRHGRRFAPGWVAIGIIAHGTSVAGGHGLGLATLLSGPAARLALVQSETARLDRLLGLGWDRR